MVDVAAVDAIIELLDGDAEETINTSMRLPKRLREASAIAVGRLGAAASTTALTSDSLRRSLERIAVRAALDAHYEAHPSARPTLYEIALAAAEQEGDPLAAHPDLLRRAAAEVIVVRPDANADDVLLWAKAKALTAAS